MYISEEESDSASLLSHCSSGKSLLGGWRVTGETVAQQIIAELVQGDWSSSSSANPCSVGGGSV